MVDIVVVVVDLFCLVVNILFVVLIIGVVVLIIGVVILIIGFVMLIIGVGCKRMCFIIEGMAVFVYNVPFFGFFVGLVFGDGGGGVI